MLNRGLISYIYTNLKKGYELNDLRTFLYQNGYPIYDIDEAIRYVQTYYPDASQPAQPSVPQTIHHKVEISKSTIAWIFIIFFVFPGLFFAGFKIFGGTPSKLLDISAEPIKSTVQPGEKVTFEVTLDSFGSQKRYDTTITAMLIDKDENILDQQQIVKAVETKSSEVMDLLVPSGTPIGRYMVKTEVKYKGVTEEASFMLNVGEDNTTETQTCSDGKQNQGESGIDCGGPCTECQTSSEPSCFDGIKNQDELKVDCGGSCKACRVACENCVPLSPCTLAECVDGQCVYTDQKPCCGNFYCEDTESYENCPADCEKIREDPETPLDIKKKAKKLAGSDAEEAASLCNTIQDDKINGECFKAVAQISEQSVLCKYINISSVRDACYMEAALRKDYSVCDKIEDRHHKSTCKQLQQMAKIEIPEELASQSP